MCNIMSLAYDCLIVVADIHRKALLAIQDISLNLGTESTSRIVKRLSPLLIDAENEVRLCICNLLESLAKVDPSLVHVVSVHISDTSSRSFFPDLLF